MALQMKSACEKCGRVLEPQGEATNVTWAMHGPVPLMAKVMHMVMDIDKMVGTDFAAGLANMKTAAEK